MKVNSLKSTGIQIVVCGVVSAAYGMYASYVDPKQVGLALLGIMMLVISANAMMSLFAIEDRLEQMEQSCQDDRESPGPD